VLGHDYIFDEREKVSCANLVEDPQKQILRSSCS
jgi:hypothetical protein